MFCAQNTSSCMCIMFRYARLHICCVKATLLHFACIATSWSVLYIFPLHTQAFIVRTDTNIHLPSTQFPQSLQEPCVPKLGAGAKLWNIFIWGSRKLTSTFHLHRSKRKPAGHRPSIISFSPSCSAYIAPLRLHVYAANLVFSNWQP